MEISTRGGILWTSVTAAIVLANGAAHACPVLEGWQAFSAVESSDPMFGRSTTTDYRSGFGGDPISLSLHVARGGGLSDTLLAMDSSGLHSSWTHDMTLAHDDAEPRTAFIYEFTVNHNSSYSIDGFYSAIGDTRMSAIIDLWDRNTGTRLFKHHIDSFSTDPTLTLGQNTGFAWYELITGSKTGTLLAGGRYRLDVDVFLRSDGGIFSDAPAVAGLGEVNLDIFACPTPGALSLLGAAGLLASRRRRIR